MRLLVVEDEPGLDRALRVGLAREGFVVDIAATVQAAKTCLAENTYDLVILDLTLPDGDGVELCQDIRAGTVESLAGRGTRILMLTARDALSDRVRGLNTGADDYLTKPFAFTELVARVRAVLRRTPTGTHEEVIVGDLTIDPVRYHANRAGRELSLTPKEFAVLEYLAHRPGQVVSAEQLLEEVWDANADPFSQTVRVTVGTLRRKLTLDDEEPMLETVIGRGYRLVP